VSRALQDLAPGQCFGCGPLNAHGLQIKSFWAGDEVVCAWRAQPQHIGYPGVLYGGLIASIVDCHCIWTAAAWTARAAGVELDESTRVRYVTASLKLNYRQPVPIGSPVELRARVTDLGERKAVVSCTVHSGSTLAAEAEVVAVRKTVPGPAEAA